MNTLDVGRIGQAEMHYPPAALDLDALHETLAAAARERRPVTAFGRRHSQGDQTLLHGAVALDLDAFQRTEVVTLDDEPCIRVQCGATWDHVHHALLRHQGKRWAPLTHQSSPHFSVGGSLAVNCHGRDPGQGPVAAGVRQLSWMDAEGQVRELRPGDPLFAALLGGYGACGLMLEAWIALKPEVMVAHRLERLGLEAYLDRLHTRFEGQEPWPALHHGWLCFAEDDGMFGEVIADDAVAQTDAKVEGDLRHESWVSDDLLSAAYATYRQAHTGRAWWNALATGLPAAGSGKTERLLNAMRAPVRFTALDGGPSTDLLQEYFLPLERAADFLRAARGVLLAHGVNLLTSTLRPVQRDTHSLMPYATTERCVGIVLNFNADLADARQGSSSHLDAWTRELVQLALDHGGSFYLAYHRGATREQFERAYGPGAEALRKLRAQHDPQRRFDNGFLRHYLG